MTLLLPLVLATVVLLMLAGERLGREEGARWRRQMFAEIDARQRHTLRLYNPER